MEESHAWVSFFYITKQCLEYHIYFTLEGFNNNTVCDGKKSYETKASILSVIFFLHTGQSLTLFEHTSQQHICLQGWNRTVRNLSLHTTQMLLEDSEKKGKRKAHFQCPTVNLIYMLCNLFNSLIIVSLCVKTFIRWKENIS